MICLHAFHVLFIIPVATGYKQYNNNQMTESIREIDCSKYPYRNVWSLVHQELCQLGRVIQREAVYRAFQRGDKQVQKLYYKHVKRAEAEAEERQKLFAASKKQSGSESQAVVS